MSRTNDREQIKQREEVEQRRADELRSAFQFVLGDYKGRLVLWSLLEKGHIFQTTFTGNSTGMFKEGERNMALGILDKIMSIDAESFVTMQVESRERNMTDDIDMRKGAKSND